MMPNTYIMVATNSLFTHDLLWEAMKDKRPNHGTVSESSYNKSVLAHQ